MANLQDIVNRSEVGAIKPWTKTTAPDGYLLCNGAAVSRSTYADLFAVISTTYGSGDGSTTFNVPQLQGKMPQGFDGNTYNLAGTGGANTVTVSVTDNKAATSTSTQSVTVTGNIDNTSLTTSFDIPELIALILKSFNQLLKLLSEPKELNIKKVFKVIIIVNILNIFLIIIFIIY